MKTVLVGMSALCLLAGALHAQTPAIGAVAANAAASVVIPDAAGKQKADALFKRSALYKQAGDLQNAIADLSAIVAMPDEAPQRFEALRQRGALYEQAGDRSNAYADHVAIFRPPTTALAERAPVFFIRKVSIGAVADSANKPKEGGEAPGHYERGLALGQAGDFSGALKAFNAAIGDAATAPTQKTEALFFRALAYGITGDLQKETADYDAVLAVKNAPAELRTASKLFKIMSSGHSGGIDKTIGEFSAILAKPEITVEQRAVVSYLRGLASGRVGNVHKAIEDFYAVTLLTDAPEGLRKTVKSHFKENPAVADFF